MGEATTLRGKNDLPHSFASVRFSNYKALREYSISLGRFNVLVGPNNSGKSTIIGAFRILAEGLRRANYRKPELVTLPAGQTHGYPVALAELPVASENVFSDYDESRPATITFRIASGNKLKLTFPAPGTCYLTCETKGRRVRTTSDFRREFPVSVGFVPVLGPVEHHEPLFQPEAARRALLTHGASRNFRNIWYHYPADFDQFRELVRSTWPGMDIERPEIDISHEKSRLHMFCPESRYPREIYWAGFGFQVWCQMLTFLIRGRQSSLLVVDEPDIYLHSDLQRQLVNILREIEADILLATHSTEIITEAEPGDLLVIDKKGKSARRIKDVTQLQAVFDVLGSNLNPTLTQLAKSRRVLFVEGKDFQILSAFARRLGRQNVANRSDFAVVPVEGFSPKKVADFSRGMELTLGVELMKAVVFDRDYRSDEEVAEELENLRAIAIIAHIHSRKEIENFLLVVPALDRTIRRRLEEQNRKTGKAESFDDSSEAILDTLTSELRGQVFGQFSAKRNKYRRSSERGLDSATINTRLHDEFEETWATLPSRLSVVPGKLVLAKLNEYLQDKFGISVSPLAIVQNMPAEEVPSEIAMLIEELESFRHITPGQSPS